VTKTPIYNCFFIPCSSNDMECLRRIPAENILQHLETFPVLLQLNINSFTQLFEPWAPVIDDVLLPQHPFFLFKEVTPVSKYCSVNWYFCQSVKYLAYKWKWTDVVRRRSYGGPCLWLFVSNTEVRYSVAALLNKNTAGAKWLNRT